jgi:hypothetical protein
LKSVSGTIINVLATANTRGLAKKPRLETELPRTAMTVEILYLTARIHHWLNVQVARHLAAQAARLSR